MGGWYDIFLPCQVDDYHALRAAGRNATLTIGPWSHVSPGVVAASLRDALRLFDDQLGDTPSRVPNNVVHVFVMGSRRRIDPCRLAAALAEQRWYLGADGHLHRSESGVTVPDRFRYDPADPTPGIGGPSLNWATRGRRTSGSGKTEGTY